MSASLRKHRISVYLYSDAGSGGVMTATYTRTAPATGGPEWWASRAVPTGREATLVAHADHRADAVFGFAAECPVTENSLLYDGTTRWLVRAVLPRDYGRDEVQVLADRTNDAHTLTN